MPIAPLAGHYLAALDRDCPAAYKGKFLAYKRLKKCLKKCQAAAAAASAGQDAKAAEAELERCQLLFFELLSAELSKANRCGVRLERQGSTTAVPASASV